MSKIFELLSLIAEIIGWFFILFIALTAADILWHKIKGEYYR